MNRVIVLLFFINGLFFLITLPTIASESEWIVHFDSEDSAQEFEKLHSSIVQSSYKETLRVQGIGKEELEVGPGVTFVEPNHPKKSASSFNDELLSKQWYLNQVLFTSVQERYSGSIQNLFIDKLITTETGTSRYSGQSIQTDSFIIELNLETLSRISIGIDHVEGPWTLTVTDSNKNILATNSGSLSRLDVLMDKKTYETLSIELSTTTPWSTPPTITSATGVNNIRIGVLDSGVSFHEDLCDNILLSLGENFTDKQPLPIDGYGHGTHVTGIIAACSNNYIGVSGVTGNAPVDVIPFKILNDDGIGGDFEISQAVEEAISMKVDVLNLSLSGKGKTTMLENALKDAYKADIPVVVAAGNYNSSTENVYPASYPEVLTVSSINEQLNKVGSSNYGWAVDISAPGENILSTHLNNTYKSMTGTSMATPIVTGAVAILKQEYPDLSITELHNKLTLSTKDILESGYDPYSGSGIIDYSKLFIETSSIPIEWLNAKEGQPHIAGKLKLAFSPELAGSTLYLFNNEQLVDKKTIDSQLLETSIDSLNTKPKTKLAALVVKDKNVLSMESLYLNNPSFTIKPFTDVTKSYWAYADITNALKGGYIHGYDDGSYKPLDNISRRHATVMLNRLFRWDNLETIQAPFNDVQQQVNPHSLAILSANKAGVINGYPNGSFYPEKSLSRGQMALILARSLGVNDAPIKSGSNPFLDVSQGTEIFIPVTNLAELGIITKQEYFRPSEPINRAQFAAMINRTHQYLHNNKR